MSVVERLSGACAVRPAGEADTVDGVPAQAVARPSCAEQTSALLAACHAEGLAVVVRGHGSKLTWGRAPERVDVILETGAMDELVEHSRGDLVATAGAGMPLARLGDLLAEGGHQLVVDDLAAGRGADGAGSTLGGAVATGLSGPRRLWAGPLRDLVIGVRLVLADGTIARSGGKVVKNVAGYDLAKLLTGSYGTLAVVTEVTVRLHPLPQEEATVLARVPHDRLGPALALLVASQLAPRTLEVSARPGADPLLSIGLGGSVEGTRERAQTLAAELGSPDLAGSSVAVVRPERPPEKTAQLVADKTGTHGTATDETDADQSARPTLVRATSRLSGIPELVREATDRGFAVTGSAGVGVLHARLPEGTAPDAVRPAVEEVRALTLRLGGSTVVLDAPPAVKAGLDAEATWGPVPGLDLMRRVKAEFDPVRLLAPGRFVGGL